MHHQFIHAPSLSSISYSQMNTISHGMAALWLKYSTLICIIIKTSTFVEKMCIITIILAQNQDSLHWPSPNSTYWLYQIWIQSIKGSLNNDTFVQIIWKLSIITIFARAKMYSTCTQPNCISAFFPASSSFICAVTMLKACFIWFVLNAVPQF